LRLEQAPAADDAEPLAGSRCDLKFQSVSPVLRACRNGPDYFPGAVRYGSLPDDIFQQPVEGVGCQANPSPGVLYSPLAEVDLAGVEQSHLFFRLRGEELIQRGHLKGPAALRIDR